MRYCCHSHHVLNVLVLTALLLNVLVLCKLPGREVSPETKLIQQSQTKKHVSGLTELKWCPSEPELFPYEELIKIIQYVWLLFSGEATVKFYEYIYICAIFGKCWTVGRSFPFQICQDNNNHIQELHPLIHLLLRGLWVEVGGGVHTWPQPLSWPQPCMVGGLGSCPLPGKCFEFTKWAGLANSLSWTI